MKSLQINSFKEYKEQYKQSVENPEKFWSEIADHFYWQKKWDKVLEWDFTKPEIKWFLGGQLNITENCLDRHLDTIGNKTAIIWEPNDPDEESRHITYRQLFVKVSRFANVLKNNGIEKGDRVCIYMPMIPESVIAMLACARLGAVHSVVFGGFAPKELATRITDAKPKVVVSASCGIEFTRTVSYKPMLDKAIDLVDTKPQHCIIFQRPQETASMIAGRDLDWNDVMASARPHDCVPVLATDPLYILYTSGTTAQPKGVVRDNGGHAVSLKWSMKSIYNVEPGDVFWAASDVGWVVGHSYIVYGPLFKGCTTILFEGKPVRTPDAGVFWRVISEHKVKCMFTAPTAFRAIKREDPKAEFMKKYDLSCFKTLFLAGERSDPDTLTWAESNLGVPVIDHWWQTETGWAISANCMGLHHFPVKYGSTTKPAPGWDLQVVDAECNPLQAGKIGALVVKLPLPPGTLPTLWHNDEGYKTAYLEEFPGYYKTADAGYVDDENYVYIMSRTDDIINVAGHRLSTGAMEEVLADHPDVAECAVFGVEDSLKGQIPIGLVVLNAGVDRDKDEIVNEVVKMVRERIGPVAAFKIATVVKRLPKTRSGKILRGTMQKIADNKEYGVPATIDDPATLKEINEALISIGYSKARNKWGT